MGELDNMQPPAPASTEVKANDVSELTPRDHLTFEFEETFTKPTAEKKIVAEPQQKVNASDFEEEATQPGQPGQPPKTDAPATPAKKKLSAAMSAEILLHTADGIQSGIFTAINYMKKKKRVDDIEDAEALVHKVDKGDIAKGELDDKQRKLYLRMKRLMEIEEAIPFTDGEKDKMQKPLAMLIQEAGYEIPPSLAFGLIVAEALTSRITSAVFD